MTPGFAKPRSKLPWLPYGVCDRVTINAHNFTPIWTPSVNGKMPTNAWVPTRSGNATDSIGANNGTLTNGASIVSDTGAGGSQAFSLDGTDDYVSTASIPFGSASWSCWLYHTGGNNLADAWSNRVGGPAGTQPGFVIGANGAPGYWYFFVDNGSGASRGRNTTSRTGLFANNTWVHLGMSYNTSSGEIACYVNGSDVTASLTASGATFTGGFSSAQNVLIGARPSLSGRYFSGRSDDFRMWNQVLTGADFSALYAAQRGGQA